MLLKKLWRTMGVYKAQFLSMIVMIAIGIGIFVGFNMEWYSIEKNTSAFFEATGLADYTLIDESGYTAADTDKIRSISGVEKACRFLAVTADVGGNNENTKGDTVSLSVTEDKTIASFMTERGSAYDEESADGIWLSVKYADANGISVGDEITLSYQTYVFRGKVQGLIRSGDNLICTRDETQLMPDYNKHGFAYVSPAMLKTALPIEYYPQIKVIGGGEKKEFKEAVNKALGKTTLVLTKDENTSYVHAQSEAEEGKTMGSVLPVVFLLIAVLTMVTTMHRLTAKEKTQIGTLKALGFTDRKITAHYTSYAFSIGLIGSLLGVGLGYFVAWFIMNPNGSMGTYFDMPEWKLYMPWFCVLILAAIVAGLTFIGFLSVRKMLSGTAADALRPYTPKKMKKLAMEKTKLWHKFSFGTRWNIRDIMRHKSRTLMSLLGIIGCSLIIIAVFGMRDSMNSFLGVYYNGAMQYSSRIYLSEDATTEQREAVVTEYDGDWSASVASELNEKTISVDVYNVPHDNVRFPDHDNRYVSLSGEGVYVCTRLSDEFHLKEGSHVEISPYGSDKTYDLVVAGVIRSISENIVMSKEYADSISFEYKIDSVYTALEKSEIAAAQAIKSVQSKQDVMDSFDSFLEIMNMMIVLCTIAALVLGLVVLYNLGIMSYTERYREMATLKVVGFKDKKIGGLLIGQNLWVTLLGVLIGIPLGVGTLSYLLTKLASEYEMKVSVSPLSYLFSISLVVGVSLLVSLLVARKNKKIDMVEALKGAE